MEQVIHTIQLPQIIQKSRKTDIGGWFLFFFLIYIILLIKALTIGSGDHNIFFFVYSITVTVYILSRFLLAYFYKTYEYDPSYVPSVSFVIPAKNEEDNIGQTLRCCALVNYPQEKIEIIAINDGSTDNTLSEMRKVRKEFEHINMEIVSWKMNRGKREGMAAGVRRASHEIVIFVDSDSFVDPECVKHLVKYFKDPSIGAVSGHTDVYNSEANLLTRMQTIRYYLAFRVYKTAEALFGTVTCCPGCCSAYRREYLLDVLDPWLDQRFLGGKCTFGDDRSLTNYIIRKYQAVYSPEAQAYTVVPETFLKYMRQQQRWKKSWVRETFIAASFMWKKHPLSAVSFYSYMFLAFSSPVVFVRAVFWHPISTETLPVAYLGGLFLMLFLHGLYYRIQVGNRNRAWMLAIFNFWFNSVILMWQLPYAIFTIRDARWGTR